MWLVDIEMSRKAKPVRRLAKFHGGVITSLQSSPIGYFIATTSLDGWLHIYDVTNKKLVFTHDFKIPITSSIWLPQKVCEICIKTIRIVTTVIYYSEILFFNEYIFFIDSLFEGYLHSWISNWSCKNSHRSL